MIHNIRSEYESGATPTKECEALFKRCLQACLRPYSEEINQQNGTVVMMFVKDGSSIFRLENVDESLRDKIINQFPELFLLD
jgi:hypothetical protein